VASFRIEISAAARREFRALPGYVRAQALQLLESLATEPRPPRSKELRDKPNIYRLWLARQWRVVYALDQEANTILILRVRRKEQIDYDSLE
jgi:mRNA-degrading endonuclease RelE of RelBE toxin-antitoxin system